MSLTRRRLGKRTVTAEGEGSLTVPGLVSSYPKSLEIQGRTYQKILTGKNLFDIGDYTLVAYNINSSEPKYDLKIENGVVYNGGVYGYSGGIGFLLSTQMDTTYTLSFDRAGEDVCINICQSNELIYGDYGRDMHDTIDRLFKADMISNEKVCVTFTPTKKFVSFHFWSYTKYGCQISNIQLELGTTATEYEPYCGGIPAPNPDYPQDIQCVKAGTKVKVGGKNLFNVDEVVGCVNKDGDITPGYGYVRDDGTIVSHMSPYGTITAFPLSDGLTLLPGTYTISTDVMIQADSTTGDNYVVLGLRKLTGDGYSIDAISSEVSAVYVRLPSRGEWHRVSVTITLPEQVDAALVLQPSGNGEVGFYSLNRQFRNIQLELGTEATPYEPYVEPQELTVPCDLYEGDIWRPLEGVVEKKSRSLTLNGTEAFDTPGVTKEGFAFYRPHDCFEDIVYSYIFCKYMRGMPNKNYAVNAVVVNTATSYPNTTQLIVACDANEFPTAKSWTSWLAEKYALGEPFSMVYDVSKPITEPTTPTPVHTYHGTTVITASGEDLLPGIKLTAYKGGG